MKRKHDIGPLSFRASVTPGSFDEEARTVELTWTTGARVLRGFFERYYEELSLDPKHVRMDRLNGGAPLLDSHNGYDLGGVIGVVEEARLEKGKGTARVRFARAEDDANADSIFRKVKDGVIRNVSVGYRVHRYEKVEGGEEKIPVYRATDWEPYEISMVPMGADAGAGVRAAGAETNPCEFVDDDKERSMAKMKDEDASNGGTEETKVAERAAPADVERARKEAAAAERKRIADIKRAASALRLGDEFVQRHIDDGTEIDEFRALGVEEAGKQPPVPGTGARVEAVAGGDERDKWVRGVTDAILVRSAAAPMVEQAAEKRGKKVEIDGGEFRGMSLVELARMSLERAGVRTAGMSKLDIVGRALVQRGGAHSTGDFPTALENAMHKALLAAYAITPDTWSRFCAVGTVSDFRPHHRYRMGTLGSLPTVVEGAEYKNMALADSSKESLSAVTKGGMIAITRQAIINDDMGVFSRVPQMVGRTAKLTIETMVYALLAENTGLGPDMADGNPLFDAAHANVGTSAAISVASIDADRVLMAAQQDPSSNEYLDLKPAILLVPSGLGGTARVINEAQYDPDTASKLQRPNMSRGLYRDIVDTARISGTRRYSFADPAVAPVLEVVFLDGQQEPFLDMQEGWRTDGAEWKVRIDVGAGVVDFRGAVTNAGT